MTSENLKELPPAEILKMLNELILEGEALAKSAIEDESSRGPELDKKADDITDKMAAMAIFLRDADEDELKEAERQHPEIKQDLVNVLLKLRLMRHSPSLLGGFAKMLHEMIDDIKTVDEAEDDDSDHEPTEAEIRAIFDKAIDKFGKPNSKNRKTFEDYIKKEVAKIAGDNIKFEMIGLNTEMTEDNKWVPEGGAYSLDEHGKVTHDGENESCHAHRMFGMEFETKKQARKGANRYKVYHKLYKLQQQLDDGWSRYPDNMHENDEAYHLAYDVEKGWSVCTSDVKENASPVEIYFKTNESAKMALKMMKTIDLLG